MTIINTILKNKLTNILSASLVAALVFFVATLFSGAVSISLWVFSSLYVAGGLSWWVLDWFKEKYVELNK